MTDLATVLDRLGGRRGLVDGALPPLVYAAVNAGATAAGSGRLALPLAVAAALASAGLLALRRRAQGSSLAGLVRGLSVLAVAAAVALWSGRARDFFLPGLGVDAAYAVALAVSAAVRRPLIGTAYTLLVHDGRAWRDEPRLRRVLLVATWGFAATYALRAGVQAALYVADAPALLALAKLALGWPLTAAAVALTLRAVRRAATAPRQGRDSVRPHRGRAGRAVRPRR
ncbi:DUF3159 domain-containing protein [Nocardioides taihuensis]|uniref:DUF3159 domain-containing protein n=1 Tax=Nocardioides taihuensis TaxID=1835606 RepID=A0ABW0BKD3_9ACTN